MQQPRHQDGTEQNTPDRACAALLRAIARPSATGLEIRQLAQDIRDWHETFRVAREHRVLPLLFTRLAQAEAPLPAEAQQRLQSEYQRNVFHCMANAAELIAILALFHQHGISAMPFKGVVLAASIYGDANARAAGDLDLLVHLTDLKRATELLFERGYQLGTPAHADLSPVYPDYCEFHFERPADGRVVELRWKLELIAPRYRRNLGLDWVWPCRRTAVLAGADVPDIDPVKTLLMLCMHGTKHEWTRLAWIIDVAQLLAAHPDLDWKAVDREARNTGLWRTLALGVLLARRIADAPVPRTVLRGFESVGAMRRLAQFIDENLLDPSLRKPPGLVPYAIRILSFRDCIRLILTFQIFKPGPLDHAFVRLPRPLHPLYYLVRPLRLLLDRSPR